ncbi:hypothetical protein SAMN05216198_1336 [Halopseudomonas litoralis]|uniref:Uncharacterized protein n=1 Tax=Halopseudomonas litoralis TaxID=797277 RepID=A0A1H1PZP5_9GAMM|nr:STY4528 family pathogenicity island replication protein [Halopseudomonas litoralis]SDS16695.1 hypothetical protein SAMN05216198_1336 [Halopseudomonas litoralis]
MDTLNTGATGPVPLRQLLDSALHQLNGAGPGDGFLFSGNRHESVPRGLLLDRRLTPLERNAWQVFRLLLSEDGITTFPTYDQLRPYLASMPCVAQASHETVARALTALRLTRWLSLARRRRDPRSGRILANLYVLHDEPLTPYEAIQIDPEYLGLISNSLTHASKSIKRLGHHVLNEWAVDPFLTQRSLPTRLQVLTLHLADNVQPPSATYPQPTLDHQSEEGEEALLRIGDPLSSDSEAGLKPSNHHSLPIPKQDRTVVLNIKTKEVRTVPRACELPGLCLPDHFSRLKNEQQAGALVALKQVEQEQRQAVLDEWAARCHTSTVRNPAGYLFGIIQKAVRGEFKAWATQKRAVITPASATPQIAVPSAPSASPESVRIHLARMRAMLNKTESGEQ